MIFFFFVTYPPKTLPQFYIRKSYIEGERFRIDSHQLPCNLFPHFHSINVYLDWLWTSFTGQYSQASTECCWVNASLSGRHRSTLAAMKLKSSDRYGLKVCIVEPCYNAPWYNAEFDSVRKFGMPVFNPSISLYKKNLNSMHFDTMRTLT